MKRGPSPRSGREAYMQACLNSLPRKEDLKKGDYLFQPTKFGDQSTPRALDLRLDQRITRISCGRGGILFANAKSTTPKIRQLYLLEFHDIRSSHLKLGQRQRLHCYLIGFRLRQQQVGHNNIKK